MKNYTILEKIKGGIKGVERAIMANIYGFGGETFKEKWSKLKNHVSFSAKTARDNSELEKLTTRLQHLMKQGTMGNKNSQTYIATYQLIELINGDTDSSNGQHRMGKIRSNNGLLTQNYQKIYLS